MAKITGKCSTFGGPGDTGVGIHEGLALYGFTEALQSCYRSLFLPNLDDTRGLARQLNPLGFYCAMRWDYTIRSRRMWRDSCVTVRANGHAFVVRPVDWGPAEYTGRIIDLSPGAAKALCVVTDDEVEVEW